MTQIHNRNFFTKKWQAKKGRLYVREFYEKTMRVAVDGEKGKGQIMMDEISYQSFELDIILPYFKQMYKKGLKITMPSTKQAITEFIMKGGLEK